MRNKRWVYLYLNGEDNYADAKYTAWPLLRVLRKFKKQYQNWTSIEVRTSDSDETMVVFKREQQEATSMKTYRILVLNDGETWSGVDGASICVISKEDHDALCTGEKDVHDIEPIAEIALRDSTEEAE